MHRFFYIVIGAGQIFLSKELKKSQHIILESLCEYAHDIECFILLD